MIKANFNAYQNYVTDSLYQWDLNQKLSIEGLSLASAPEVHFSNDEMDRAIVRQSSMTNGVITVDIPNSLLQVPARIFAYIGTYQDNTFMTVEVVEIPVIPKVKPLDYRLEDSDGEVYSFNKYENRFATYDSHISTKDNPHKVTAQQVGALPLSGGTLTGDLKFADGYGESLFGVHNKPSGNYTGNGSSESRTVDVGGKGALLVITSDTGTALVTNRGAICHNRSGTAVSGVVSWEVNFNNGVLTIVSTNEILNSKDQKYYYQVV